MNEAAINEVMKIGAQAVSEMSREELLVMIGFIGKSYARWKEESSNLNSLHLS